MRKVDGEKKEKRKKRNEKKKNKRKKKEKNVLFSGHYVIASSRPPEWHHPNDDRWNAAHSCQNYIAPKKLLIKYKGIQSLPTKLYLFDINGGLMKS